MSIMNYLTADAAVFMARTSREKWLITLAGFTIVFSLFFTLQLEPNWRSQHENERAIDRLSARIDLARVDVETLQLQLAQDPDRELDQQLLQHTQQQQLLSQQLSRFVGGFVAATEMASRLHLVLNHKAGLTLQSLTTLPVESVQSGSAVSSSQNLQGTGYYVHPVKLELVGSHLAILEYLRGLEDLEEPYSWRRIRYEIDAMSQVKLSLVVYTLGLEPAFIGGEQTQFLKSRLE